ncbi:DsbC family protein [uncultured Pseudoteredinibacter sp.]|uniref:DsbC family protein n=1 Tax=uncultured Pseudoteredinibacter sp. TaxID=1641701 RepID=UPI002632FFE1|nr:DsbC family protein [uncultured Pseudoteredinibacter sp.]
MTTSIKMAGKLALLASMSIGMNMAAQAQSTEIMAVDEKVKAKITENMSKSVPGFAIQYISHTPAEGLYSVQVEQGPKVFVNADGTFIINEQGQAIVPEDGTFVAWMDPVQRRVEEEIKRMAETTLNKIPDDELIVYPAKGEKKGQVYVFTDVDCGYCRKLHLEVPKMNEMGIEVKYLAFPRSGPVGASADKLARAFCAKNRGEALTELKNGGGLDREVCAEHPIQEHLKLVRAFGLSGTPGIFLADGTKIAGYVPAEELARRLKI